MPSGAVHPNTQKQTREQKISRGDAESRRCRVLLRGRCLFRRSRFLQCGRRSREAETRHARSASPRLRV